jgi:hypothetical protein
MAFAGQGHQAVGHAEHRLGSAQVEQAIRRHAPGQRLQHPALGRRVEIDQHVPAEDHVEAAQSAQILQ